MPECHDQPAYERVQWRSAMWPSYRILHCGRRFCRRMGDEETGSAANLMR
jgi:hypothetical protein